MECIVIILLIIAFMILGLFLINSENQNYILIKENKKLHFSLKYLQEENAELRDKIRKEGGKI